MSFDFEADLRFPTAADDWVESLVIGTVLSLFSGLLLPLIPLQGYLLNCARAGMAGDEALPSFTDWERLVGDGLRGLVVLVVYQLPALFLGGVSITALLLLGSDSQSLASAGLVLFVLGLLAAFLLSIVAGYLGLVGLLTYAVEDDLRAAFDPETLRAVGFDSEYAIHWGYGLLLVFLLNALFGVAFFLINLIAIVPLIGWLIALLAFFVLAPVGTALSFYTQQVIFRVWGRGYAVSRGLDASDVPARLRGEAPTAVAVDDDASTTISSTAGKSAETAESESAASSSSPEESVETGSAGGRSTATDPSSGEADGDEPEDEEWR